MVFFLLIKLPYETPHALGLEEIPKVMGAFAEAAKRAIGANFDGIELHAGIQRRKKR
jgi:2,4-dienoyl-CoA reductase-like NADH-dependent reductase (Old Yellow Enzyme family)